MFESHITFQMDHAKHVKDIERSLAGMQIKWRYSQIDGDPVLGAKVFCYLSAHAGDFMTLKQSMEAVVRISWQAGIKPRRTKIEAILLDERF